MIILLGTDRHQYTHRSVGQDTTFDFRTLSYSSALRRRYLPRATYIFGDLDRLDFIELELAARLHRVLQRADARVLNDPARVRQRYDLLQTLYSTGINRFNVWRVEETRRPDRFPVFLRNESGHDGAISDLLENEEQVDRAVEEALNQGIPRRGMLLVEYCAEPIRPNLYQKLSMYRIGERLVPEVSIFQSNWHAKQGELGIAGQELYDDDMEIVTTNRHADSLDPVFEQASTEYGRVDFGLVEGDVQVYEINTNPTVSLLTEHPFPVRVRASSDVRRQYNEALQEIDTSAVGRIKVDDEKLKALRKLNYWTFGRWPF